MSRVRAYFPSPYLAAVALGLVLVALFFLGTLLWQRGQASDMATGGQAAAHRAYLGIVYLPLTNQVSALYQLPVKTGAMVTAVAENSPAQMAGLRPKDVIVAYDGVELNQRVPLVNLLMGCRVGDQVELTVLRQGKRQSVTVSLGSK